VIENEIVERRFPVLGRNPETTATTRFRLGPVPSNYLAATAANSAQSSSSFTKYGACGGGAKGVARASWKP
jgi:hypothetical protein